MAVMQEPRFFVSQLPGFDHSTNFAASIRTYLGIPIEKVQVVQIYTLLKELPSDKLDAIAEKVLIDPFMEKASFSPPSEFDWAIEVHLKPGLTDNLGQTAQIAIEDYLGAPFEPQERVCTSTQYLLWGKADRPAMERVARELMANPLIHDIYIHARGEEVLERGARVMQLRRMAVEHIPLPPSEKELLELSKRMQLALNVQEMLAIRAYYARPEVISQRTEFDLPAMPTDVEIEALAQTWSEHCKHKIFNARIHYREDNKERVIESLFHTYIKKATDELASEIDWLVSVFTDNAGIIRLNETLDLACKVETHNSPSALDPYGGALTGILGVNRDILGTGKGCRPIANMDVLCFAPPNYSGPIPERLMHPKRVLDGVCKGIEHGGNKSGIPTVNGAILFDERFLGKPLVYCGTVGLMPRGMDKKEILPGDLIAVAGGRTGKDGIHGATFSSEELHAGSPSTAVQIGDPFTQKKLLDFMLEAQEHDLYRTLTDNGAGGISSSVGEMAQLSGGCEIHLERVPLKYPNLRPWEILLSESQERMTFAVPEESREKLLELAAVHDVEIAFIGTFTATGLFHVFHEGKSVALLTLDFLHCGVPQLQLDATWTKPAEPLSRVVSEDLAQDLVQLLGRYSICSKESVIRQYDHEVQGGSALKPLVGKDADGPGDASILRPIECREEKPKEHLGIVVSNGICPRYSSIDTYHMAGCSVDEAIRNQVAVGADPDRIAILDNFCWPDPIYDPEKTPDGKYKLAQLVRACEGLYDAAKAFRTPIISGKDSMKNDYKIGSVKISVPPTLLITAVGKIPDVTRAVSMDVKAAGDLIYVLGVTRCEIGASEYFSLKKEKGGRVPRVDFLQASKLYRALFQAIQKELVASCHDCSEGGLGVALAESAFAGGFGMEIDLKRIPTDTTLSDTELLFSESASRFVVTIDPASKEAFEAAMDALPCAHVGRVVEGTSFTLLGQEGSLVLHADILALKEAWQSPLRGDIP